MWKRVEWLIALFILLFYAGPLTPSEMAEGGKDALMGTVSIVVQTIVIPLTVLLVLTNWNKMIAGFRAAALPMAIGVLLVLSTAWSIDRHLTLRRGLILFFTTLFGVYLGARLRRSKQIHLYAVISVLSMIGCYVVAIFFPSYGISADTHLGDWKGLFQHKNILGRQMVFALTVIAGGCAFRRVWLRWAAIAGTFLLLGLSRSGTALFGFSALLFAYGTLKTMRVPTKRTLPLWVALLPLALVGAAMVFVLRAEIATLLGKDPTLTGRTMIWGTAFSGMAEKPWFGWGYAAFWRQVTLRPLYNGSAPTHAHDGFFDIVLDTGFFGLGLFAATLFSYVSLCMRRVLDRSLPLSDFSRFAFLFLLVFLAVNLTESNLLRYHTFLWLPFVSIYTAMALQASDERRAVEEMEQTPAGELSYQAV